nr:MAG TPA: hypothetical protein [Caudoviricetes sp.]
MEHRVPGRLAPTAKKLHAYGRADRARSARGRYPRPGVRAEKHNSKPLQLVAIGE